MFIHKIWLKYVFQLSSFAPLPSLAHGCQLNPRDGVHRASALGRSAKPRCPPVSVFCEPYSSFGTAIQSSPKSFALSNALSPVTSRSGRMLGIFCGEDPPEGFHQKWEMPFGVFVFERGFWLQATNLALMYKHFTRKLRIHFTILIFCR